MRAATRSAFSAELTTWISTKVSDPKIIVTAAVAAFGTYWFVNIEEEDVYYFAQYYYRETGPGRFDINGNFLGDYEIKKVERTTKNSNNTGGQTTTTIKKSTIISAFF